MRQMKRRVNGNIIPCVLTDLLSQQPTEPEIRALCMFVRNGVNDYSKVMLVLYFLMCFCLIFMGFVLVSCHHHLQSDHASQQHSVVCSHHLSPQWSFWLVHQFWHLLQINVQVLAQSYIALKDQLSSPMYTHTHNPQLCYDMYRQAEYIEKKQISYRHTSMSRTCQNIPSRHFWMNFHKYLLSEEFYIFLLHTWFSKAQYYVIKFGQIDTE